MASGMADSMSPPVGSFSQQNNTISAPAFLDLADSAARQSSNLPDINSRIEQKRIEHERQRLHTRKAFEEQMRKMEQLHQQEERELLSLTPDPSSGHQHMALSAPTTPPRGVNMLDNGLASQGFNVLPIPTDRVFTNGHRSGQREISPNAASVAPTSVTFSPDISSSPESVRQPVAGAKSMPGSRRGSNSKEDAELLSMGALSLRDREPQAAQQNPTQQPQTDTVQSSLLAKTPSAAQSAMSPVFNDNFLLDDELDKEMLNSVAHLPIPADDDKFPILVRTDSYPGVLSVSSAALDLAPLSQAPMRAFQGRSDQGARTSEWPQFSGPPRPSDSGPMNRMDRGRAVTQPQLKGAHGDSASPLSVPPPAVSQRLSPVTSRRPSPPGSNDAIPSIGSLTSRSVPGTPLNPLPGPGRHDMHARTPVSPSSPMPSTELSSHVLQAQGQPPHGQSVYPHPDITATFQRTLGSPPYNGGSTLSFGSITQSDSLGSAYGMNAYPATGLPNSPYGFDSDENAMYEGRYGLGGRLLGGDPGKMNGLHGPKHKRGDVDREFNRFAGTRLEDLVGEIPSLCKDQHGCRYLQKKLEEGTPEHRDMIFRETFGHFADLMTDPFGNYLCQKLLEYSTDEQRNLICESVALDLVGISLNMHGTRAVQKMIDFLSTQRQIHAIIIALSMNVVTLIKDLNGNHVIQKCLNRLMPEDNQFIYNAVAAHCVEVATHRHGCCVLQRCVDHASESQRIQLVTEITYNALTLVQDPYGNYVVQYILDLNDNRFSDAVIRQFIGNVIPLSMQKFSSNVIEKCIRVAEVSTRKLLIEEFLNRSKLEKLLRDSFGNYCVQTALDYADPAQRMLLVDGIRPILPLIRNTPYGKRIQSKLQREQIEAVTSHYGGYHQAAHAALVNLAMSNNGMNRHMPQPPLHHPGSLNDVYNPRSSVYPLGQPAMNPHQQQHQQQQQQQLHVQQLQSQAMDQYGQQHVQNGPNQPGLLGNAQGNAFQTGGVFPTSMSHGYTSPGGSMGGPANDVYQGQHGPYPYM